MNNQIQAPDRKRPWDVYHNGATISEEDRIFKIAQSMVIKYSMSTSIFLRGHIINKCYLGEGKFKYSEKLREIISQSGQDWVDQKCATVLAYCMFVDSERDDIPDEEKRSLVHLYTTHTNTIPPAESDSTSTSGSSSPSSSDSSSKNGDNEGKDNPNEAILNFQPLNKKPNIKPPQPSALLGPLIDMIRKMPEANAIIPETSDFELPPDAEDVGEHIEMNLGLGVLEHIVPTLRESAIRETSRISVTNKRKATNAEIEESQIPSMSTKKDAEVVPANSSAKKLKVSFNGRRPVSISSSSSSSGSERNDKRAPAKSARKKKRPTRAPVESSSSSSDSEEPPLKTIYKLTFKPSQKYKGMFNLQMNANFIEGMTAFGILKPGLNPHLEPEQQEVDAINEDIMERVTNDELEGFKVSA